MKRIRFELGLKRGRKVTQVEFAQMISELLGLPQPLSGTSVLGWEKGAEPGFLAGCAIAHLGGLPAEALAFKSAGRDAQDLPRAPRHPITGDDRAKPAKRRRKGA